MKFLEENEAYIDCANDDINTTNANGKFLSRLLMNMSQNEIERTSARNNAKNNLSGSSSLANNGIQSARQLSKVNNHDFRKYDEDTRGIYTLKGCNDIVYDVKEFYKMNDNKNDHSL